MGEIRKIKPIARVHTTKPTDADKLIDRIRTHAIGGIKRREINLRRSKVGPQHAVLQVGFCFRDCVEWRLHPRGNPQRSWIDARAGILRATALRARRDDESVVVSGVRRVRERNLPLVRQAHRGAR